MSESEAQEFLEGYVASRSTAISWLDEAVGTTWRSAEQPLTALWPEVLRRLGVRGSSRRSAKRWNFGRRDVKPRHPLWCEPGDRDRLLKASFQDGLTFAVAEEAMRVDPRFQWGIDPERRPHSELNWPALRLGSTYWSPLWVCVTSVASAIAIGGEGTLKADRLHAVVQLQHRVAARLLSTDG